MQPASQWDAGVTGSTEALCSLKSGPLSRSLTTNNTESHKADRKAISPVSWCVNSNTSNVDLGMTSIEFLGCRVLPEQYSFILLVGTTSAWALGSFLSCFPGGHLRCFFPLRRDSKANSQPVWTLDNLLNHTKSQSPKPYVPFSCHLVGSEHPELYQYKTQVVVKSVFHLI